MIAESELRLMAERRGLERVLALEPAVLNPLAERGTKPLAPVPSGPTTEPAGGYDPARHAEDA